MGNKNLLIRNTQPEELDEVSLLLKEAYLQYENFIPPERWKHYLADIVDIHSRLGESDLIVAELYNRKGTMLNDERNLDKIE